MSDHSTLFVGNTSYIEVTGLADRDGEYQNDATVTMESLTDLRGTAVSGVTVPLALTYIPASNGDYRGTIPAAVAVNADRKYLATVKALGSQGFTFLAVETVIAATRRE
jgi:hypothetical protein